MSVASAKKARVFLIGLVVVLSLVLILARPKTRVFNKKLLTESKYRNLADWIEAQSKFETATNGKPWTSELATKHNNLFGMNCVAKRDTTQIACTESKYDLGGKSSMGVYRSWDDSIKDFILYLDANKCPTTFYSLGDYVSWLLSRGYFTTTYQNYLNGLKSWM